jgi:hypothetical protein
MYRERVMKFTWRGREVHSTAGRFFVGAMARGLGCAADAPRLVDACH